MKTILTALPNSDPEYPETCKGLFFRFAKTGWIGGAHDINVQYRYRFLKGKSCPGCERCLFLWDDANESLADMKYCNINYSHGQEGKIYRLKVDNVSTDWETEYVDNWDLSFELCEHINE